MEEGNDLAPKFNDEGIMPVVVTEALSGTVLMIGYMNEESLKKSISTGEGYYWSRSRKLLWHKGASSGMVHKIKEILSRLHNTSFSYVETTVEYEKQLKQSFLPFLSQNHPEIILARDDTSVSMKKYIDIISRSINSDKKLKANFIMVKRYLDYKLSFLRLYNMSLDDLEREINLVID